MGKRSTNPLLVFLILYPASAMNDYCRNHTFDIPTDSEALHFSKENSDREYGIYDEFKCLHCCSHGYRSIEWFKNGRPYPWPTNVSTLIVHPESGNQTICSLQSTAVDSGRYWCIARNSSHFLRHDVHLQISGSRNLYSPSKRSLSMDDTMDDMQIKSDYVSYYSGHAYGPSISMGWPKTTYRPRDQKADDGESVRFYCEAFVGTIDLPDFQSEITWERYDLNQSFIDGVRVFQESVFREEKRVLGSYLHIKGVTPSDYGQYTCKVRNLGDQIVKISAWLSRREVPQSPNNGKERFWLLFLLPCFLVLVASMSTFCLLRSPRTYAPREATKDPKKEVLVIYHKRDEEETMKALSRIEGRKFCSYSLHPLQSKSQLEGENLKAKANSYKEVLAFLSPSLVEGGWTCEGIHLLIQGLLKVHFTVNCVCLQSLPKVKSDSREWQLLKESLSTIHFIDRKNFKFWNAIKQKFPIRKNNSRGNSIIFI